MEVSLERMHHDISRAAGSLIFRDSRCQHRIEQRELHSAEISIDSPLVDRVGLIVCDDGRVAHLGARSRKSQYAADRSCSFDLALAAVEVPYISAAIDTVADGLAAVEHGASAHGKYEVAAFALVELDALAYERDSRIRHNASEFDISDTLFIELRLDLAQKTAPFHRAAAKMYKHFRSAMSFQYLAGLFPGSFSEIHMSWCEIFLYSHYYPPFRSRDLRSFTFLSLQTG